MKQTEQNQDYDIIIISAEYFVDHPLSGVGVIKKVLEDKGYSVGIIEKPDWTKDDDFTRLGKPKLFFGIAPGSMDSMLVNYTPLKKKRSEDPFHPYKSGIPDRAVITYCNKLKHLYKDSIIVIGGIESSMRRFSHYDYWNNDLRKSILVDSRATILVYGSGEYQVVEIANRIKKNNNPFNPKNTLNKENQTTNIQEESNNNNNNNNSNKQANPNLHQYLNGIEGTCILSSEVPQGFTIIPSFEDVSNDNILFCKMQMMLSNDKNLAQKQDTRYLLQYKMHRYTPQELDHIYSLNYSRNIPYYFKEFKMVQFSVVTHRGCIGNCNFCALSLHQGNRIISRSEKSILDEIKKITKHKDFKGYIDDLGGPSANMYGMDCNLCNLNKCLTCAKLDKSHRRLINLLREARKIPGINKIFIRSGIRYDLAIESEEYVKEIAENHISGCLKIAPEHVSEAVLNLMNKRGDSVEEFKHLFHKYSKNKAQELKYYFMVAHPGETEREALELKDKMSRMNNTDSVQVFTPTPMTISTCMYHTAMNPYTLKPIYVPYTYREKKDYKNSVMKRKGYSQLMDDKNRFDDYTRDDRSKNEYSNNTFSKDNYQRNNISRNNYPRENYSQNRSQFKSEPGQRINYSDRRPKSEESDEGWEFSESKRKFIPDKYPLREERFNNTTNNAPPRFNNFQNKNKNITPAKYNAKPSRFRNNNPDSDNPFDRRGVTKSPSFHEKVRHRRYSNEDQNSPPAFKKKKVWDDENKGFNKKDNYNTNNTDRFSKDNNSKDKPFFKKKRDDDYKPTQKELNKEKFKKGFGRKP